MIIDIGIVKYGKHPLRQPVVARSSAPLKKFVRINEAVIRWKFRVLQISFEAQAVREK